MNPEAFALWLIVVCVVGALVGLGCWLAQWCERKRPNRRAGLPAPSPLCDRHGDWRAHVQRGRF